MGASVSLHGGVAPKGVEGRGVDPRAGGTRGSSIAHRPPRDAAVQIAHEPAGFARSSRYLPLRA